MLNINSTTLTDHSSFQNKLITNYKLKITKFSILTKQLKQLNIQKLGLISLTWCDSSRCSKKLNYLQPHKMPIYT